MKRRSVAKFAERLTILKQKNVILVVMISFGETELANCLRCKEADTKHEIEYPSKRTEIKNDKKVVVCEAFQSYIPLEIPKLEPLNIELTTPK